MPGKILSEFKENGYARVKLTSKRANLLKNLYEQTMLFSRKEPIHKKEHSSAKGNNGYRPLGAAHAGDPNQVDWNDSFIYWGQEADPIPNANKIAGLIAALDAFKTLVAKPIMGRLVAELANYYDKPSHRSFIFDSASLLQFNSFHVPSERELLQTRHEDGVVATVIWTSAPGLEVFHKNDLIPLTPGPDEVFVMPGGILEVMTGGEFPPLFHLARNVRLVRPGQYDPERKSIMYFSNFDPRKQSLEPYICNQRNEGVDLSSLINSSPDMFGLPDNFYETAN